MKRFFIELIGTFFLTLALALTGNPLCYGLIFAAVIYLGAHISGGYYNPAISVALYMRGKHKREHLAHAVLGQLAGAMIALYAVAKGAARPFSLNVDPANVPFACLLEILLAFLLCAVVLSLVAQKNKDHLGLIAGFTLMALGYIIPGAFNPAISLGNQILCALHGAPVDVNALIVYFIAPFVGGGIAALIYDKYQD